MINNRPFPSVRKEKREKERRIYAVVEKCEGGGAAGGSLLTAEIGAEKGAEKWESRVGTKPGGASALRAALSECLINTRTKLITNKPLETRREGPRSFDERRVAR